MLGTLVMFKLPDWWSRGTVNPDAHGSDSLETFGSEQSRRTPPFASRPTPDAAGTIRSPDRRLVVLVALVIVVGAGLSGYFLLKWKAFQVEAASASLSIESDPVGADVLAAGVKQGTTPLTLSVAPGEHVFEVVYEGRRRLLRTVARAGAAVVHHVQFDPPAAAVERKAALHIITEPAKLRVVVDGVSRGVSPLTVEDVEPGAHRVQVIGATGTLARQVTVGAGETASVIISATAAPAGPAAGWLTVSSPIALQILEGQDIIGTSQSPRIMLPAGSHALQLTNESLGFTERRVVQIKPGSHAAIRVDLPTAPLSINALPWAEAWVDGKRVGETPIGNHLVHVGTHEVVFRHPELGERRQTVTVSLKTPARVSVDMRKPQL